MFDIKTFMMRTFNCVNESRQKKKPIEKKTTEKMISFLDACVNKEDDKAAKEAMDALEKIIKPNGPMIYAFITDDVPDSIKVGYTTQFVHKRIDQWRDKYHNIETIGWWPADEFTMNGKHVFFMDHAVHEQLRNYHGKGFKQFTEPKEFTEFLASHNVSTEIHYSREFFKKYIEDTTPEERVELSDKILKEIIDMMHEQIKGKKNPPFTIYTYESLKTSHVESTDLGSMQTYKNTDLQNECIEKAIKFIGEGVDVHKENYDASKRKHMLMSAVMRFGKTHTAYEIIRQSNSRLVLVATAKPDVYESWRDDVNHRDFAGKNSFAFLRITGKDECALTTYNNDIGKFEVHNKQNIFDVDKQHCIIDALIKDHTVIVFASLQDLAGSNTIIKAKHRIIADREFDMLVIDETHYGSHAQEYGKSTGLANIDDDEDEQYNREIANEANRNNKLLKGLNIKYKICLQISGTPYYILSSNEFNTLFNKQSQIISDVSYTDILKAHDKWIRDNNNKPGVDETMNPYYGFPRLHKIGLHLTQACRKIVEASPYDTSFKELFKAENKQFVHEAEVKGLMEKVFGDDKGDSIGLLKNKVIEGSRTCKHTIMVLPTISSCEAMKKLLEGLLKGTRDVICIVGSSADKCASTVASLNDHLADLDERKGGPQKSLILTVNRFLTGVSMPLVDSMIYLKNTKSSQDYDQAIFRMCTRCIRNFKYTDETDKTEKTGKGSVKTNVYLIDLNVGNMFDMLAKTAMQRAKTNTKDGTPSTEKICKLIKEELEYAPIYGEGIGDHVLGKIHEVTYKDLMKVYTNYNVNKTIDDSLIDEMDTFNTLFANRGFNSIINGIDVIDDKGKKHISNPYDEGGDTLDIEDTKSPKQLKDKASNVKTSTREKAEAQMAKLKFRTMLKRMLLCNLCLPQPQGSLDEFTKAITASDMSTFANKFFTEANFDVDDVETINKAISSFKSIQDKIDSMFLTLMIGMQEAEDDVFVKKLGSLGRLGKSEFVTPHEIVNKMIDKCEDNIRNAKSILLVNEKQCEFLVEIKQRFGTDVAKKCRIVPSGEMTKILMEKMLNRMGLNTDIIINIPDKNNNYKYDLEDFLNMKNEEFKQLAHASYPFSVCLMNPPYSNGDSTFLDVTFVNKVMKMSNKVVAIFPNCVGKNHGAYKDFWDSHGVQDIYFSNARDVFDIIPNWDYVCIYDIDSNVKHDTFGIEFKGGHYNIHNDNESRKDFSNVVNWGDLYAVINNKKDLYGKLMSQNRSMCHDGHGFIYEENKPGLYGIKKPAQKKLERVKRYLKDGTYKYCIYKGSGNNSYDKPQEWFGQDPDELFNGQCCWLTNSSTVRDNIRYWMECPLFDLWRKYYFNKRNQINCYLYTKIPALDFEMSTKDFKQYVDSLNDFTESEISIMKRYNIHNIDKYDTK